MAKKKCDNDILTIFWKSHDISITIYRYTIFSALTMSNATWVEKYLEDRTHGLCMQQVWIQEQLKVLVKQHLEISKIGRWYPGSFWLDQTWLFWFERQKFWRNWWASRISSFILTSSFWSKGICSRSNTTWIDITIISDFLIIACLVDAHVSQQPLFMLPRLQRSTQAGLGFIHMGYFSQVFLLWVPEHTSCSSDRESAEWFCNSVIGSAQGGDLAIQSDGQHICFHP